MVIRSTFLFSSWNRNSKTDDPVIISSLTVTPETKTSSDSLCPTILNLPHPTLQAIHNITLILQKRTGNKFMQGHTNFLEYLPISKCEFIKMNL